MNVWQYRHRLLVERLRDMLHRPMDELRDDDITRVFAAAYVLLTQHKLDKRGRCRYCQPFTWWRRKWKTCTVNQTFGVAMTQPYKVFRAWLDDH